MLNSVSILLFLFVICREAEGADDHIRHLVRREIGVVDFQMMLKQYLVRSCIQTVSAGGAEQIGLAPFGIPLGDLPLHPVWGQVPFQPCFQIGAQLNKVKMTAIRGELPFQLPEIFDLPVHLKSRDIGKQQIDIVLYGQFNAFSRKTALNSFWAGVANPKILSEISMLS